MRNLRNIQRSTVRFADSELPLAASTWDTSNNSLVCAFGPTESSAVIELRRVQSFPGTNVPPQLIASWDAPCPTPDLPSDSILDLHYFSDTAIICLVLAGGDIVIVREQPLPGEELLEIAGSVDAGISAATWSPDEELLTICTKADTILFMSRDFEGIADIALSRDDVKVSNHVSVGWGKAETQFKGKRAKALRDPTMPETVDEGLLSSHDDDYARISWRGDGAFVAVNTVEEGKRRMIRIYSREGTLDSVSEPVDYLEGPISWRPAGNIIAGVRRLEDSAEVIFFERNGLRHGQFSLRLSKADLDKCASKIDLLWNVDSSVLAVCLSDRVQLWTMGNYHYYLKQEIRFPLPPSSVRNLFWHPEKPLQLVLQGNDQVLLLNYTFTVTKGSTNPPDDFGTVAVVDGNMLKLTPLRMANVPPPLALHELQLGQITVDVVINSKTSQIAILDPSAISIYNYVVTSKQVMYPELVAKHELPDDCGIPYQLTLNGEKDIVVLTSKLDSNQDSLYVWSSNKSEWEAFDSGMKHISIITNDSESNTLCIQDGTGSVTSTTADFGVLQLRGQLKLPIFCPWIEKVNVAGQDIVFGLSLTGNLYANHLLLVSNCTSFLVTTAHLIFTTTHHLLQFVHLTSVEDLEVPPNEPETDERCRSIERGARLITAMPSSYSLALQMPRGNLETIYPRALVLAGIRRSIEAKKYKKAFLACRNQRVDMNIIHDHAPQQFMQNVTVFVDQIKKVEHIDLFLSQLREEDVSQTMYKETLQKTSQNAISNSNGVNGTKTESSSFTLKSKINRICDAFLEVLQTGEATNHQNIITANVCKFPPDLEGGLRVVAALRDQGDEIVERAAEHICFLADVNQLYDTALGMYDLELTLLIAQQSQKDPREYLPYLQSLQEMESLRRQFVIDDDLGHYKKALTHLHLMDTFDEVKKYAEKHELHSTAIELYKYKPERLDALMRQYANFLATRNRFKEAGLAYEHIGDYDAAIPNYRQANLWREALSCAALLPLPPAERTELAESLADELVESKDYQSAATVHLEYLSDVEGGAKYLCKAYLFADAMRIVGLHQKPEMLKFVIDAGLVDGFNSTTELLADCKNQLNAQVPRLKELRLKKEQDPVAFYAGDPGPGDGADIPDNVSIAQTDASTSGGTFLTRYTGRTNGTLNTQTTRKTSKNRRREERKRARGKKGSVYEEEYLVNSIGRLIERVNSTGDEVTRLVEGLVRRSMRERAVAVEKAMSEVVETCHAILPEVFQAQIKDGEAEDEDRPMGADGVLWDAMQGGGMKAAPVVKAFEKLSLIA